MKTPIESDCATARFSPRREHRYFLGRRWTSLGRMALWVMFNPSVADENEDDPTIRKVCGFSKRWGFNAIGVINLVAQVSTDPWSVRWGAIAGTRDAPENTEWKRSMVEESHNVIVAWGDLGRRTPQELAFLALADRYKRDLLAIGSNASGSPTHPVRAPYTDEPVLWRAAR